MAKINQGPVSMIAGLSVLVLALLVHFIVAGVTGVNAGQTLAIALMAGLLSAAGLVIVTLFSVLVFRLSTKARDGLFTGGLFVLTILIIANLIRPLIQMIPVLGPLV